MPAVALPGHPSPAPKLPASLLPEDLMSTAENNCRVDYVEFPAADIPVTKCFYSSVFGWKFQDYGPDYTSFHDGRLSGGFRAVPHVERGGPLVVIYTTNLEAMKAKIQAAGGAIVHTHEFPGGRRFHFHDPSGNELAVWSEA